jgi:antitoxin (DNA-binding transcriptional repressor) of toxin-antitoxin stability system
MPKTASIRDLRNRFPAVRRIVESEGEVLLTEAGTPKYRLMLHTTPPGKSPSPVNYWTRLTSYQPDPISAKQAAALHEENRGDR